MLNVKRRALEEYERLLFERDGDNVVRIRS